MGQERKWVLILFFPVTIYMFLGTALLFLLYKMEQIIEALGDYSEFPGIDYYEAKEWHNESIWLTIFFPVVWLLLAIWELFVLNYAILAVILRFFYNALILIVETIVDFVEAIWNWTVEAIEYVWETIAGFFS